MSNGLKNMRDFSKKTMKKYISVLLIAAFLILSFYFLDAERILAEVKMLAFNPALMVFILTSYFAAFFARSEERRGGEKFR